MADQFLRKCGLATRYFVILLGLLLKIVIDEAFVFHLGIIILNTIVETLVIYLSTASEEGNLVRVGTNLC